MILDPGPDFLGSLGATVYTWGAGGAGVGVALFWLFSLFLSISRGLRPQMVAEDLSNSTWEGK